LRPISLLAQYAALFPFDLWYLILMRWLLATAGYRPFTDDNFNTFVEMATTMNNKVREHCDSPEYAILFQVRYIHLLCLPVRGWRLLQEWWAMGRV
jgi:hypothetical protein